MHINDGVLVKCFKGGEEKFQIINSFQQFLPKTV